MPQIIVFKEGRDNTAVLQGGEGLLQRQLGVDQQT